MYRIIRPEKDAYITSKIINKRRSYKSNVGQAATLDLYSLFDESIVYSDTTSSILLTSSVYEYSRALIQFDYTKIQELHDDYHIDLSQSNYTASLKLIDVYGGQTTPSNFILEVLPLAKPWLEGRGFDVVAYQHIDIANWLTASLNGSQAVTWSLPGAAATGSIGDLDVDVYISGNLGSGNQYIGKQMSFLRGDENFEVDVTSLVSASVASIIPNNGFRIALTKEEEESKQTYFVKRFGTKQVQNKDLAPRIDITTTQDIIRSDKAIAKLSPYTQSFFIFNESPSGYRNFIVNNSEVTGLNCLVVDISTSKQVNVSTSSFSVQHNMSISYMTKSIARYVTSFSASQFMIGSRFVPGIYVMNFVLDPYQDANLYDYLSGSLSNEVKFTLNWKNPSDNKILHNEEIIFGPYDGLLQSHVDRNYVLNIYNLKSLYSSKTDGYQRLRVFIQDYNTEIAAYRYPYSLQSQIIPGMRYRIKRSYQNIEYIPFCEATELSYDENGMFFDLYISDFDIGYTYQIDFSIPSGNGSDNDIFVQNQGWKFKVID